MKVREQATVQHNVDFTIEAHDDLCALYPVSDLGKSWFYENIGGRADAWLLMDTGRLSDLATLITGAGMKIGNTEAGLH